MPDEPSDKQLDETEGVYIETNHYFKQMDDGRWMQVDVDVYSKDGVETGYVVDAKIHDNRPSFEGMKLIYKKPMN